MNLLVKPQKKIPSLIFRVATMTRMLHIYEVFNRMSVSVGEGQVKSWFLFFVYQHCIHVFYEF